MDIDQLREEGLIIFEALSGSRAYGLAGPESDTDMKGVFVIPREKIYGFSYPDHVHSPRQDNQYYELAKFLDLAWKNNPTVLEMIVTPPEHVFVSHPVFGAVRRFPFFSRKCRDSFGQYAFTQIKKAKGLNKKFMAPMPKERKTVEDFCFVLDGARQIPVREWLAAQGGEERRCGLVPLPPARDLFALYVASGEEMFSPGGITRTPESDEPCTSEVPAGLSPRAHLFFHRDGYRSHCAKYREYWEWVDQRNEARYQLNLSHGQPYDSKNMMHVFRLLGAAAQIAREGTFTLEPPDKEFLLRVKAGQLPYQELLDLAGERMGELDTLYENSSLPVDIPRAEVERLLVEVREAFYSIHEL